ncbi:hypothetical protein [Limnohabitans sp.]|jgi:hypothetical protein|uniref:hypothetical protein n=1 Tax=Limnohabitans sp. TaxID=1907725 RepID=UPI00333E251A
MPATPHDGSGSTFTFAGVVYTVTNITYTVADNNATDNIDVSHLGQTAGSTVLTMSRPLKGSAGDTGKEVTIDYLPNAGATPIAQGVTGTLVITGGITLSAAATCRSSTITLATNDSNKGSASFQVA